MRGCVYVEILHVRMPRVEDNVILRLCLCADAQGSFVLCTGAQGFAAC